MGRCTFRSPRGGVGYSSADTFAHIRLLRGGSDPCSPPFPVPHKNTKWGRVKFCPTGFPTTGAMEDTFCVSDYIGVRPAWVYAKCLNDYFAGWEASQTPPVALTDEELESFLVFGLQVASVGCQTTDQGSGFEEAQKAQEARPESPPARLVVLRPGTQRPNPPLPRPRTISTYLKLNMCCVRETILGSQLMSLRPGSPTRRASAGLRGPASRPPRTRCSSTPSSCACRASPSPNSRNGARRC